MGKRGPKRAPIETLARRGSWLAAQRIEDGAPLPPRATPDPPDWLSKDAGEHWPILVELIGDTGVLTAQDAPALALLADAIAFYIRVRRERDRNPLTTTTTRGDERAAPLLATTKAAWGDVLKALAEFGLTPSSRSAIQVPRDAPPADKAKPSRADWFN